MLSSLASTSDVASLLATASTPASDSTSSPIPNATPSLTVNSPQLALSPPPVPLTATSTISDTIATESDHRTAHVLLAPSTSASEAGTANSSSPRPANPIALADLNSVLTPVPGTLPGLSADVAPLVEAHQRSVPGEGTENASTTIPLPMPGTQSLADLADLVSKYRRTYDFLHHSWINPLGRTLVNLFARWNRHRGNDLTEAQHAAALLLLPGVLRKFSDTGERPVRLLERLAGQLDPTAEILQTAAAMARDDNPPRGTSNFVRTPRQKRLRIQKLVGAGRLSAAMSSLEQMIPSSESAAANMNLLTAEATKAELARLHPLRNEGDDLGVPPAGMHGIDPVDKDDVKFFVRRLDVSTTSGWSGWTNRSLKRVVLNCADAEALTGELVTFYARWLDGTLAASAADLFAVGRAVLIPKEGGGLRPLGIGDPWYRLGAQMITARISAETAAHLAPLQVGSGMPSGCEIAARTMQIALDCDGGGAAGDVCLISIDIRNAFNSIRRKHILQGIRDHCPGLEPYFRLFYGRATELRLSSGELAVPSGTGVRQGDPLAMILFALGFQAALEELKCAHSSALAVYQRHNPQRPAGIGHIIAYADDVGASLPASVARRFCNAAQAILERYDLQLVPDKCCLHGRRTACIPEPPFPIADAGIRKILGCPIGGTAFRATSLAGKINQMTACIPELTQLGCHSAFLLLTRCVNQRAQYLARVLEAPDIQDQLKGFDATIDDALANIIECGAADRPTLSSLRRLPQRLSGLGAYIHSGPEAECGRNSSRNQTIAFFRTHAFPRPFKTQIEESWPPLQLAWGGSQACRTVDDEVARKAVRAEQNDAFEEIHRAFTSSRSSHAWAALLLSNRNSGSGRWLNYSGGLAKRFQMRDALFKDALRLRCMVAPSAAARLAAQACSCSPSAQQHLTHLLDCKSNQWSYTHRHNTACDILASLVRAVRPDALVTKEVLLRDSLGPAWRETLVAPANSAEAAEGQGAPTGQDDQEDLEDREVEGEEEDEDPLAAAEAGTEHSGPLAADSGTARSADTTAIPAAEPASSSAATAPTPLLPVGGPTSARRAAAANNRRSDLIVLLPNAKFTLDVSFVNPGCRKYIRTAKTHLHQGSAAEAREKEKMSKYADLPGMEAGGREGLVPFIIESTGRLGKRAKEFLKAIVPSDDTFHLSNFLNALSAMSAMHLSIMLQLKMREFTELEHIVF
eukprot:CAMPEP_0184971534 /NCGR_PEP_ID=MMETSP1098-20130426/3751_1 /TAXON_ID=89044 /ORGANISM="Spumella elongata, Strain CCAP 955/1" /LENGTH=1204 /DNA_ID=CAMNT_0027493679 /DNA_START=193 /DNA_END=3807 /DNA_ORIENTATION=-